MGSYDFNEGQVTKPEIQVPYNRVQDAISAGYKLHPDEAPRYQNDTAHSGAVSRVAGQVKSILSRMTAPMPDTPLTGNPLQQALAPITNVAKLPFNIVNRTLRGVVSLPQGVAQSAWDFTQGRPEGVDPVAMAENSYKGLQQDTENLGPVAALGNLGGDATTMYLAGKAGTPVLEGASNIASSAIEGARMAPKDLIRRIAGTGPGVARELVRQTEDTNRNIARDNAGKRAEAQSNWEEKQAAATAEHQKKLVSLRQKFEDDQRKGAWDARVGTAEDQKAYWDKRRVAKQKYEQDVRDQTQKFQTERAKAEQTNAEAQRAHNQKIGETAQNNKAATEAERAKTAQNVKLQVGGSQLIYGLRQLNKALNDRAAKMYDAIREKVGGQTLPGTDLGHAARKAMAKISGTSITPTVFRDILGKYPESDPEFIQDPTTGINSLGKVGKDSPYYELLKQRFGGEGAAPPVTFKDLQGYHSELGAELAKGTLPGDVYQATRDLQESVTDMMQDMAKKAGANNDLITARKFYREYMDTFHEPTGPSASGSPVAQALLAKDPLVAAEKFAGKSGDRGIAFLQKYSNSLAKLAQDVQRTAQTEIKVPARKTVAGTSPEIASVPTAADYKPPVKQSPVEAKMPPPIRKVPKPLPPDDLFRSAPVVPYKEPRLAPPETISYDDMQRANERGFNNRGHALANYAMRVAGVLGPLRMLGEFTRTGSSSIRSMAIIPAAGMTGLTIEELMSDPGIRDFFTKPTKQQLAAIPDGLKEQMPEMVEAARGHKVPVSPLIAAYAAAIQRNRGRSQQPAQQQPTLAGAAQ
jgi:hypothetical protein